MVYRMGATTKERKVRLTLAVITIQPTLPFKVFIGGGHIWAGNFTLLPGDILICADSGGSNGYRVPALEKQATGIC